MPHSHDTSIFARTHALEGGERVRLRLAHRSDAAAVRELLTLRGVQATELEVRRALSYDPTRRRVLCAFVAVDGHDVLVGLAGTDLASDAEIDLLVSDEQACPGVGELLGATLARLTAARRGAA